MCNQVLQKFRVSKSIFENRLLEHLIPEYLYISALVRIRRNSCQIIDTFAAQALKVYLQMNVQGSRYYVFYIDGQGNSVLLYRWIDRAIVLYYIDVQIGQQILCTLYRWIGRAIVLYLQMERQGNIYIMKMDRVIVQYCIDGQVGQQYCIIQMNRQGNIYYEDGQGNNIVLCRWIERAYCIDGQIRQYILCIICI